MIEPTPVPPPVTVRLAVATMLPVKPFMLAEIVVVPADTPWARPVALTVATEGSLEVHVTWLEISSVVEALFR
jgi:hypothetical protein